MASINHDIHKVKVELRLQGMVLSALEDMCRDRRETPREVILDILEQRLVRDKYLPDWWFQRKGIS